MHTPYYDTCRKDYHEIFDGSRLDPDAKSGGAMMECPIQYEGRVLVLELSIPLFDPLHSSGDRMKTMLTNGFRCGLCWYHLISQVVFNPVGQGEPWRFNLPIGACGPRFFFE